MASWKDIPEIFLTKNSKKSNADEIASTSSKKFWINQLYHDLEQANKFDHEHKVRYPSRPWIQSENPEAVPERSRLRYFFAIVLIILAISLPLIIFLFNRSSTNFTNEDVEKVLQEDSKKLIEEVNNFMQIVKNQTSLDKL